MKRRAARAAPTPAMADDAPSTHRILVIAPEDRFAGGMRVQANLLADRLRGEGHRARILPTAPALGAVGRIPGLRTLVGGLLFLVALLARLPRTDVVLVFAASGNYFRLRVVPAILLGRLLRRRVVVSYRGGAAPSFFEGRWWWIRRCLGCAHRVIVPGPWLAQVFSRCGGHADIVPTIADVDRFPFRERPRPAPRLLVARHHEPHANLELALQALARVRRRHPDATLTLAGRGTDGPDLRARVRALGLEGVTALGAVASRDMPAVYAAHDLLLSPVSLDNLPNSILEAHAAGLAVVATRVGGVPDLVADGRSGLLVPPTDAEAMAAAVDRLLGEPGLALRVAREGRRVAEAHAWARWRRAWIAVLLGARPARRTRLRSGGAAPRAPLESTAPPA